MILTVTLNAAIDKRYVVEEYRPGQVNRVKECTYTPGGKGLNVAKALATAGAEVTATGLLGGCSGSYIEKALSAFAIRSDFYHLEAESRSCVNIWDEKNQRQTEFLEPGFTVTEREFEEFLAKFREMVKSASVVALSGSAPRGLPQDCYRQLVEICKEKGKKVILDTSGALLEKGMEAFPTMIKPNRDEIKMLTGKSCESMEEILEAAERLYEMGIETVAISLGSDGCVAAGKEGIYRAIVPKMDAVNTVGCGDTMIAGFALGMAENASLAETLRKASAISAASAMHEKTGMFRMEDMERILPQITIIQEKTW